MAQECISINSMFKKPEENKVTLFPQNKMKNIFTGDKTWGVFFSKLLPTDLEVVVHVLHVLTQWL